MKMVCDGVRIEVQSVERGKSEDGAGHYAARRAANADDDDILKQAGAALEHARQTDGEDGDGNGGFHSLADLKPRVGRGDGEDDAEQDTPEDRAQRQLRRLGLRGDDGFVGLAGLQRKVGVFRQRGFGFSFEQGRTPLRRCFWTLRIRHPGCRQTSRVQDHARRMRGSEGTTQVTTPRKPKQVRRVGCLGEGDSGRLRYLVSQV